MRAPSLPSRSLVAAALALNQQHIVRAEAARTGRHSLNIPRRFEVMGTRALHRMEPYAAPEWAQVLKLMPTERFALSIIPTPIHSWHVPGIPDGVELYVKRDDLTGMQLSGNKVRKLEFIMAEVKQKGFDSVITIGGIQSNHCRATAVAARYAGLECHLILRNAASLADKDPGLVGNLLVERLVGAHVHQVTKEEYVRAGSVALGEQLAQHLRSQGLNPCIIPVGGSNSTGSWGYMEAVEEIQQQELSSGRFTDIVMACGSGGTTAGLALGNHLSGMGARIWAYGVCDDPEYFYDFIQGLLDEAGGTQEVIGASARDLVTVIQAKGAGYAISRDEELQQMQSIAQATGIVLDPVYSGKAVNGLIKDMNAHPDAWKGRRVLFIHTGGLLGMYDKLPQMQPIIERLGRSHRLSAQ